MPITEAYVLVQFYSIELREEIRQLEAEYLNRAQRKLDDVRKTNLRVESSENGFEFVVESCEYR